MWMLIITSVKNSVINCPLKVKFLIIASWLCFLVPREESGFVVAKMGHLSYCLQLENIIATTKMKMEPSQVLCEAATGFQKLPHKTLISSPELQWHIQ